MASLNKVMLIGNLGKAPVVRQTQSGLSVANFSLATTENFTDKQQQRQERTEWHNIVVFGKLAEICEKYLDKGKQVFIEGKLRTRKWKDKEGRDRYTVEIIANNMVMLGRREGAAPGAAISGEPISSPFQDPVYEADLPPEEDETPF